MDVPFLIESLFEYAPQDNLKEAEDEDGVDPKMVQSFEMPAVNGQEQG